MSRLTVDFRLAAADKELHFGGIMFGAENEANPSYFGSLKMHTEEGVWDIDHLKLSDLELCGTNERVNAHSAVMVPLSPFLAAVTSNITCCQSSTKIILGDTSVEIITMVLQLLYTGEVPSLGRSLMKEVLHCLKMLGIREEVFKAVEMKSGNRVENINVQLQSSLCSVPNQLSKNKVTLIAFNVFSIIAPLSPLMT